MKLVVPIGTVNYTAVSYTGPNITTFNASYQTENGYVQLNLTNITYEEIPVPTGLWFFPD